MDCHHITLLSAFTNHNWKETCIDTTEIMMVYISKFNISIKCFPIKFENVPIGLNTWEQVSTSFCHVHYCWHMTHLFHRYRRLLLECFCLYSIVIYLLITQTVFRNTYCEAFLQIYVVCMSSGDLLICRIFVFFYFLLRKKISYWSNKKTLTNKALFFSALN